MVDAEHPTDTSVNPPDQPGVEAPPAEVPPQGPPVAVQEPPPEESEERPPEAKPSNKHWYVVKVQSGREESIKEALERRVKIEGLEEYLGEIVIPVERVTEVVKGKRVTRTRKLYPGYLFAEVEFNDRILYLFRETPGVGDFVGAGPGKAPPPMPEHEVERMKGQRPEEIEKVAPTPRIKFEKGDHVKVKEGPFAGMEGDVSEVLEAKGLVRVIIKIFGRDVPVELEYWQVEHA